MREVELLDGDDPSPRARDGSATWTTDGVASLSPAHGAHVASALRIWSRSNSPVALLGAVTAGTVALLAGPSDPR